MSHTLLGVCTACPCPMGYPQPGPRGAIGQSLKGSVLSNIRKLFTKQALEISEKNFVTKLNHVTDHAWGLYCMCMPSPVPGGSISQSPEGGILLNIEYDQAGGNPLGMDVQYRPQLRCWSRFNFVTKFCSPLSTACIMNNFLIFNIIPPPDFGL